MYQSNTSRLTELWSLPRPAQGLNTNNNNNNPSGRTMTLGSTQPLTEMSTRCISRGKGGRCVRLTTLPSSCAVVMKSVNLNFLEPSGPPQACNGTALALPFRYTHAYVTLPPTDQLSFTCLLKQNSWFAARNRLVYRSRFEVLPAELMTIQVRVF